MLDGLRHDLRLAVRTLGKSPGFALVATSTLALGIGVNSAMFGIVDAVMLRPLPYPESRRLVSIWEEHQEGLPRESSTRGGVFGTPAGMSRITVSHTNLADYQEQASALESAAGLMFLGSNLTGEGPPERVFGLMVTARFFDVLRVWPATGRGFRPDEDRSGALVAVIGQELCLRRLGGDAAAALGRTLTLDGKAYTIVGVLPEGFRAPAQFKTRERIEFYVPLSLPPEFNRGDHVLDVIGRLAPGATLEGAQAQLDAISTRLAREFPDTNSTVRSRVGRLREDIVRDVRSSLTLLMAAVGSVLVIACVNLANLLLARAVGRQRQIAIQFALGASRARIVRELLLQSGVIAACGGGAGLLLGAWLLALFGWMAPEPFPRADEAAMSARVLATTLAASIATALVFGALPAWQTSRTRPAEALRSAERGMVSHVVLRWRSLLAVAELAVTMALLVVAGLLIRSLWRLQAVDLGFQPERVLAMNIDLPEARYPDAQHRLSFFQALEERVSAVPGVRAVAFANRMPMRGGWSGGFELDTDSGVVSGEADLQAVSPGYFATLHVPLVSGRLLTARDRDGAPPVAVVNQAFGGHFLAGKDPLGRRLRRAPGMPWITIVGVVADIRRGGKASAREPEIYLSAAQAHIYPVHLADFAFRAQSDPRDLVAAVQREVWALDREQPVTNVRTLPEIIVRSEAEQRFRTSLLVGFAALALALALVGVYGVVSYAVAHRTAEFALRLALGAPPIRIGLMVVRQVTTLVAAGLTAGAGLAFMASRLVQSALFEIAPVDAASYVAAAAGIAVVALLAGWAPSRRAIRADPMIALRAE